MEFLRGRLPYGAVYVTQIRYVVEIDVTRSLCGADCSRYCSSICRQHSVDGATQLRCCGIMAT